MENVIKKNYFSLKTKITSSIILFLLTILIVVFGASFLYVIATYKSDLRQRLINEVNIAVLQVDSEKHKTLKTIEDENTDAYKDIKLVLQNIRNNSTDIYYIYTMRETEDNKISFIVDAEEDPENISHLGDIYEDPNQFLLDNFLTINKPIVENTFTSDKWGTWISAYAPFYDKNGNREGVLGIDINAVELVRHEREILFLYLLFFILSGLLVAILGIFLSKSLVNSLTYLHNILKNNTNEGGDKIDIAKDEIKEFGDELKMKLGQFDSSQKEASESLIEKNKTLEKMNELMVGRELEMIKLKKEINELKNKQP